MLGITFRLETDHKPLIPLFASKNLEDLPVMRFQFDIVHIPGKHLTIADTLSHSLIKQRSDSDKSLQQEADVYVDPVMSSLPATNECLQMNAYSCKLHKKKMRLEEGCYMDLVS